MKPKGSLSRMATVLLPRDLFGHGVRHAVLHRLSRAVVAGLILGMDQGRFEHQMPRLLPARGRSSS